MTTADDIKMVLELDGKAKQLDHDSVCQLHAAPYPMLMATIIRQLLDVIDGQREAATVALTHLESTHNIMTGPVNEPQIRLLHEALTLSAPFVGLVRKEK